MRPLGDEAGQADAFIRQRGNDVAAGDRAPCDGVIEEGVSDLDCAMLTGETLPRAARPGDQLYAGAVNVGRKLIVRVTARCPVDALNTHCIGSDSLRLQTN